MSSRVSFERAIDLPVGVPLGNRRPLVVLPLAARQRNLHLGQTVLQIDFQRNHRVAALGQLCQDFGDFLAVQQQFARAQRIMPGTACRFVNRDVRVDQVQVGAARLDIALTQVGLPGPDGFDLRAQQSQPRLEAIFERVVMRGLAVSRQNFDVAESVIGHF